MGLPCAEPGCSAITSGGRCDKHRGAVGQHFDATRPSAAKRGYGRNWRRLRRLILAEEPLCRDCGGAATEVDHIDGDGTNMARENLQALCHACHSRKTTRENGGGWGHGNRAWD